MKFFKQNISISIGLSLLTILIYALSYRGEGAHYNYFIYLADAFLNGRLYFLQNPPWLNELVFWQGHYYTVFAPMPALLLTPFVGVFGLNFPQPYVSILIGGINVGLSFWVFLKIFRDKQIAIWASLLYAFGSMQWYHAEVGSAWYFAQIVSLLFIWLILLEVFTKRRLWLIGLLIGCGYLSRLPAILSITFVVIYLNELFFSKRFKYYFNFQNIFLLFLGLVPALLVNALYNYFRFGVINDYAYELLPLENEYWYRYGLFNLKYIPIHLSEIFTAMPNFKDNFPYIYPSLNVMALWVVTPAFLLIPFAKFRQKIFFIATITILVMSLPSLAKGGNGFTQFGFRYALDFLPFLLILTMSGYSRYPRIGMFLILLSFLVNIWGVVMITILNLGSI